MMEIKIRYIRDIEPIGYTGGEYTSNWIDLRCAETMEIKKGEYALIPLGVAMELPNGYEALVAPRSSTFKRHKILLANSIGVIDTSYCGDNDEWRFPAYAIEDTVVNKGNRICQFRVIERQPSITFSEVETLGNADRGGIGSTGK